MMDMKKITQLLTMTALGAGTMAYAPAFSQDEQDSEIEEVVITGSRIKRKDVDGLGKVDVIDSESFARIGAVSVDQVLKASTFTSGAAAGSESNYLSSKEGYGTASVNLRGLGQNRTLVLVNGRRFVPGGSGANSVVDLNSIPVNMIERVETLLDGSSAVYGADAVAGVVNIITRRSFDGIQLDASFGMTQESDAKNTDLNAMWGMDDDDRGFVISANYMDRGQARSSDRTFSECYLEEEEGDKFCSGSSYTAGGRADTTETLGRLQFNQDPNGDGDAFAPFSFGSHAFNFMEYFVLTAPYERINVSANGYIDISDKVRLFTENTYTKRKSETEASPASFRGVAFSSTYPHNPTGEDLTMRRRMVEGDGMGARIWTQEVSLFRSVVGLEGDMDNGWSWDASFNYGKSKSNELFTNALNLDRLDETVDESNCVSPTAIQCVDYFGVGDPSAEALEYISIDVPTIGENEQISILGNITGELFEMPKGAVNFAAGIEHRKDSGSYRKTTDPSIRIRSGGGGSGEPIDGSLSSTEVYAEFNVPVLTNLDLNLAARYSNYSNFDDQFTYKIGADWRVTDEFRLRSTFSTAVRTPNIRELYTTEEINYTTFVDSCDQFESVGDANLTANCTADVGAGFEQGENFVELDYVGNPNLSPEEADTFTLGFIYEPEAIEGLTLSADYYLIKMSNSIRNVSPSAALDQCYYSANKSHSACDNIYRDGFGGDVVFLTVPLVNAAKEKMSGIDFGVQYHFEAMNGQVFIKWDTSYLDTFDVTWANSPNTFEIAGTISNGEGGVGSYIKWKSNLSVAYDQDTWGASYGVQYIGGADSQFVRIGAQSPRVGALTYHNLEGHFEVKEGLVLRAGVNNLFNKQPPYYTDAIDQNTDPFTYDLLGRRFFVKASYTF